MAAGEVIESLALEINIGIVGQSALDDLLTKLESLSSYLTQIEAKMTKLTGAMPTTATVAPAASSTETLTPEAQVDTSAASEQMETAAQSAEHLQASVQKASESVKQLDKNAKKSADSLKQTKKSTEEAGKAAQKSSKHFGGLMSSFMRIAKYRMLRAVIRAVTEAFKEGVQNLAKFDSQFNETMSNFVSSTAYLKNALGTLAKPLIELVTPVLIKIIDLIVAATNKLNAFIAAIKGEDTYIAAKKFSVDYAANLDKASKSAKELKKDLMGFDEINRLSDKSSSSGSGETDVNDMFERRAVASTLDSNLEESLVLTFKDVFLDWDDLNGEQIAEKIIVGLGAVLGAAAGFSLGGVPGAIIGTIAGIAITLIASSLIFNHDGRLDPGEIGSMIIAGLGLVAGAVIGAVTIGTVTGGLIGATIGLGIGLALAVLNKSLIDSDLSEEEMLAAVDSILDDVVSALVGVGLAVALITLGGAPALAITIGASLSLILSSLDPVTNIREACKMIGEQAKAGWDSVWNDPENENMNPVLKFFKAIISSVKFIFGIMSPSRVMKGIGEFVVQGFFNGIKDLWDTLWNPVKEKFENIITKFKTGAKTLKENVTSAFKQMKESISTIMDNLKTKIQNVWNSIKTGVKNFINNGIISGVERLINSVLHGLRWLLDKAKVIINAFPESVRNKLGLDKIANATIEDVHLQRFAQGGFPEDGLFMANHGELVGQFSNGRTAVANNAQIEAGIEEAAYRGFMRAMGNNQGGNYTFVAQLNGKTIFEEVVRQNNSATKAYGLSPLSAY